MIDGDRIVRALGAAVFIAAMALAVVAFVIGFLVGWAI